MLSRQAAVKWSRGRSLVASLPAGARRLVPPVSACLALLVVGCTEAEPPSPPPPPEVRVVTATTRPIANVIEVPGRLEAVRTAEVRARVDGIVQRRLYEEGTDVKAGQPLFAIDPREMRARLSAAEAALAGAEATAANARQDVRRYERLVEERAVSRQDYDAAVARLRTAEAQAAQARAQVESARLDLSHTTVTAPIGGRAGRAEVTEGALVSAAAATLLTRIEQIDPIYVNFAQSSADLMEIRSAIDSGRLQVPSLDSVPVRLVLQNGAVYPHQGRLDFLDLRIDEETGTAALRAEFPNPERRLLPGQFVRVRVEAGVQPEGMLLPQRAVTVSPQGATVLVVGANDVVETRPVRVGSLRGGSWEIRGGLREGERVVVDGVQRAQPGQPVRVAADTGRADTTTAAGAAAPDSGRASR